MEALMIGVSGMRGTIGGTLTPVVVNQMASAFATWLKQTSKPANGTHFRVVLGRDSRPSGQWVAAAATAALTASGVEVIDLDIVTTPGVAMMVKHLGADAGIVATASHNPIQWNGLKFLSRDAVALPPEQAEQVKALYLRNEPTYVRVQDLVQPKKNSEKRGSRSSLPRMGTVISVPWMNCSTNAVSSCSQAFASAAPSSSAFGTTLMPMVDPWRLGLTIHGSAMPSKRGSKAAAPRLRVTSCGIRTPADVSTRLDMALSIARALARTPLPV